MTQYALSALSPYLRLKIMSCTEKKQEYVLLLICTFWREHTIIKYTCQDPSNGGGNYGGMTVSLHTVDLAKLFVDVQKSVLENTSGMNCTCGENLLTEESITNATIKIVQAQAEQQVKRKRLLEKKKRLLRNNRIPKVLQD